MIPGVMVDFLSRASVAIASTRDAALAPSLHLLTGWSVEDERSTVVCLVAAGFSDRLLESAQDNGRLALAAEVIGPHECYQFKGSYSGAREVTRADHAIHRACRQRFVDALRSHSGNRYSLESMERYYGDPVLAVRMKVEEIYVQTPGPGAGARLYPALEA